MDAFYASVEQRDNVKYRGKPVIVGGAPDKRGVVAACSYEARKFGIHSAMPSSRAVRLCPDAIFIPPRFKVYRQVSEQIRQVFARYTDLIEPLSLDEAYLDVSGSEQCQGSATMIAKAIKRDIKQDTGLNASAGVSYNKFLAKIASDMDKPDGLYVITPEQGPAFVESLAIGKFHGIGKATEAKMKKLHIHNGRDLKQYSLEALCMHFGKAGNYYYNIARGIDERSVVSHRERKSLGTETTFTSDIDDIALILEKLELLAKQVAGYLDEKKLSARTVTIKVKYADFQQVTRSQSFENAINQFDDIRKILPQLLAKTDAGKRKVRLLGVTVSKLQAVNINQLDEHQIKLF